MLNHLNYQQVEAFTEAKQKKQTYPYTYFGLFSIPDKNDLCMSQ